MAVAALELDVPLVAALDGDLVEDLGGVGLPVRLGQVVDGHDDGEEAAHDERPGEDAAEPLRLELVVR